MAITKTLGSYNQKGLEVRKEREDGKRDNCDGKRENEKERWRNREGEMGMRGVTDCYRQRDGANQCAHKACCYGSINIDQPSDGTSS